MRIFLALLFSTAFAFSQTSWVFNPHTGKLDAVSIVPSGTPGTWGTIAGTLSAQTDLQTALNAKQPLDSDLTAIAALTTQSFGLSLLDDANATTARVTLGLVIGTDVLAPTGSGAALTGITFTQIGGTATDGQIPASIARDDEISVGYQPIDPDLTAIAALSGTNTIYYRSGAGVWSPVTIGAELTFSGGVLSATVGGGTWGTITGTLSDQTDLQTALSGKQPLDADLTSIAALTTTAYGRGFLDDANASGTRSSIGLDNLANFSTSLGITGTASSTSFLRGDGAWVTLGGGATWGAITGTLSAQTDLQAALDAKQGTDTDLTSLAAATNTNAIYYRSAVGVWSPVTMGSNLTFTGGTLSSTAGGGGTWGSITGTLSAQTDLQSALDAKQPLDADLTAIAALTTTAAGRALLDDADAAAQRVTLDLVIGTTVQGFDADLAALAALTGTNTIYYRSGTSTWTPVTIGTNLTFTGGTLSAAGGGSGTPGGADTQIQFNDASAFGGDSALTYNKTTDILTVPTVTTTGLNASSLEFEGASADAFETQVTVVNPTADRVITLPDASTSVPIFSQFITFTGPTAARSIVLPDVNFTVARTDAAQTFTGLQQFTPSATVAGINVGSISGDPSAPSNGGIWYDSLANELTARINGANVALGAGGGGGQPLDSDLTAIAALTTTSFGRGHLDDADAAAGRTTLELTTPTGWATTDKLVTISAPSATISTVRFDGGNATSFFLEPLTSTTNANIALVPKGTGTAQLANPAQDRALVLSSTAMLFRQGGVDYTLTAAGLELLNDADATAQRTTLGITRTGVRRSFYVAAGAMIARTTNGAATTTVETTTNDIMYDGFAFDSTTEEAVGFWWAPPTAYNAGTLTFKPRWTSASGTGTVKWDFAARAYADDDSIDAALGTEQTTGTDTLLTTGDMHVSPTTPALTPAGTPAANRDTYIQIARDVGGDTLNADAVLLGVTVEYTESSTEPAAQ